MIDTMYSYIHNNVCEKFTTNDLFILIIVKYSILKGVPVVVCLITRSS